MKLIINGECREFESIPTLAELLRRCDLDPAAPGLAVAHNGTVVPRRELGEIRVAEGDRIEIVRAVQGG